MYKHAKAFSESRIQLETEKFSIEQKAYELLQTQQPRVGELKFTDKYSRTVIEADLDEIARIENSISQRESQESNQFARLSETMEMMLPELAFKYSWLGDNVFVVRTSRYDDIKNDTDLVAEIAKDNNLHHLGLAIDVTLSGASMDEKIGLIAARIKEGRPLNLKYFESENSGLHGPLKNLAQVVIAVDRKTLDELAEYKLNLESLEKRRKNPSPSEKVEDLTKQINEIKEKFRTHKLQVLILEQIKLQAERFSRYTNNPDIASKYAELLGLISQIYDEKISDKELMDAAGLDNAGSYHMSSDIEESLDRKLRPTSGR